MFAFASRLTHGPFAADFRLGDIAPPNFHGLVCIDWSPGMACKILNPSYRLLGGMGNEDFYYHFLLTTMLGAMNPMQTNFHTTRKSKHLISIHGFQ